MTTISRACQVLVVLLGLAGHTVHAREVPDSQKRGQWTHARTQLSLEPVLAGLQLYKVLSSAPRELDVHARFESPDQATFATVYVFRPAAGDLPLWFDRATATIATADRWTIASTEEFGPFVPPGQDRANGLQAIYALGGGEFRSTAIAMAATDGWIIKIRITSLKLDAAEMKALMGEFQRQIVWPRTLATAPAVSPLADCPTPLTFGKAARPVRRSRDKAAASAVAGALLEGSERDATIGAPLRGKAYCRDSVFGTHGIYRIEGTSDQYLLAYNDAGRVASVRPSPGLFDADGKKSFAISYLELDRSLQYVDHDRLVSPAHLNEIVHSQRPLTTVAIEETGSEAAPDRPGAQP
ncbi:hypothetical protein C7451_10582 [Blastomonas natatoria]|uniref:DUF1254 domain-containing protein n=1 Tax=Blastomonas natatoria TaxID=34015 RepID=A0A2V3V5Z2_9SPHN|nr:hypothetical protein [Blastomonas natatoria]PXW76311.1 hypothetical protein C7451_10582 [Blastomonas natatoria]